MPIYLPTAKAYSPAPEGVHLGVLVDVIEHKNVTTTYMGKERIVDQVQLTFELDEYNNETGLRYLVSTRFTLSSSPKAGLVKFLEGWIGSKKVTPGLDLESLIGKAVMLTVEHNEKGDKTYANITNAMRTKDKLEPSGEYVRKNADYHGAPVNGVIPSGDDDTAPITDDDIPF